MEPKASCSSDSCPKTWSSTCAPTIGGPWGWRSLPPRWSTSMTTSRVGLALKAIREDEVSAASHGINVPAAKSPFFAVAASLTGIAGCIFGYKLLAGHAGAGALHGLAFRAYPDSCARGDGYDRRSVDWRAAWSTPSLITETSWPRATLP